MNRWEKANPQIMDRIPRLGIINPSALTRYNDVNTSQTKDFDMRLRLFRPLAWSTTLPCDLIEVPKLLQVYLWRYAIYYFIHTSLSSVGLELYYRRVYRYLNLPLLSYVYNPT